MRRLTEFVDYARHLQQLREARSGAAEDALREFGKRVRTARDKAGLTQQELSEILGYSRTSITNMERGLQDTHVSTLVLLAAVLGVSPGELLPDVSDQI